MSLLGHSKHNFLETIQPACLSTLLETLLLYNWWNLPRLVSSFFEVCSKSLSRSFTGGASGLRLGQESRSSLNCRSLRINSEVSLRHWTSSCCHWTDRAPPLMCVNVMNNVKHFGNCWCDLKSALVAKFKLHFIPEINFFLNPLTSLWQLQETDSDSAALWLSHRLNPVMCPELLRSVNF